MARSTNGGRVTKPTKGSNRNKIACQACRQRKRKCTHQTLAVKFNVPPVFLARLAGIPTRVKLNLPTKLVILDSSSTEVSDPAESTPEIPTPEEDTPATMFPDSTSQKPAPVESNPPQPTSVSPTQLSPSSSESDTSEESVPFDDTTLPVITSTVDPVEQYPGEEVSPFNYCQIPVKLQLNGHKYQVILDTGADDSYLSEEYVEELGLADKLQDNTRPITIEKSSDAEFQCTQYVEIPIFLKGKRGDLHVWLQTRCRFMIAPAGCGKEILIGMRFLAPMGVKIDIQNFIVELPFANNFRMPFFTTKRQMEEWFEDTPY